MIVQVLIAVGRVNEVTVYALQTNYFAWCLVILFVFAVFRACPIASPAGPMFLRNTKSMFHHC